MPKKPRAAKSPRRSELTVLVLGLGNPGAVYARTRHNVGFQTLEKRAARGGFRFRKALFGPYLHAREQVGAEGSELVLVKPLTYMNRSGEVVPTLRRRFRPDRIVVVCDNLDLAPGTLRLKRGGSGGGHRGLASIARFLGPEEYLRLYIGIGRPPQREDPRQRIVNHVLGEPPAEEAKGLEEATERAAELLPALPDTAVNELIQRINGSN